MNEDHKEALLGSLSFAPRMWIYVKGAALLVPYSFCVALSSSVCGAVAVGLAMLSGAQVRFPPMWPAMAALALGLAVSAAWSAAFMRLSSSSFNQGIMRKILFALGATQGLFTGALVWATVVHSNHSAHEVKPLKIFNLAFGEGLGGDWFFPFFFGPSIHFLLLISVLGGLDCFLSLRMKTIECWQGAWHVDSWSEWAASKRASLARAATSAGASCVALANEARKAVVSKGIGDGAKWAQIEREAFAKASGQSSCASKPTRRL